MFMLLSLCSVLFHFLYRLGKLDRDRDRDVDVDVWVCGWVFGEGCGWEELCSLCLSTSSVGEGWNEEGGREVELSGASVFVGGECEYGVGRGEGDAADDVWQLG